MSEPFPIELEDGRILVDSSDQPADRKTFLAMPDIARMAMSRTATNGNVVAVGLGKLQPDGTRAPMPYKVGDVVFHSRFCGIELEYEGKVYRAFRVGDETLIGRYTGPALTRSTVSG